MSWDLRDSTAQWNGPHWSVDVALAQESSQPLVQIQDSLQRPVLSVEITPSEQQVKDSAARMPFGEAYVRQTDLIAIFPELDPWRFGYQMDIRLIDNPIPNTLVLPNTLVMEIWLSIQTSLLDSHPQLELLLRGERFKALTDSCWTSDSSRIGLLIHPLDQPDCRIEQLKEGLAMRVFGRFMEKGVIRRMRFRLIAALESVSAAVWRDRFEEFSNSPLPLTT